MVPTVALFGLVTVKVKVETSFTPTVLGEKALAIKGGTTASTFNVELVAGNATVPVVTVMPLLVLETVLILLR